MPAVPGAEPVQEREVISRLICWLRGCRASSEWTPCAECSDESVTVEHRLCVNCGEPVA